MLKNNNRLKLFGKRLVRNVIGPRMDEVIRKWRKLNNEELNPYPANVEKRVSS
jgi:hypothetical protein